MTRDVAAAIDDLIQWEQTFLLKRNFAFAIPATVLAGVSISWKITNHCEHEFSLSSNPLGILCEAEGRALCMNLKSKPQLTRGVKLPSLRFFARPKAELSFVLWEVGSPNEC